MDYKEEIRGKLPIEDLVGGYIQLKKAGRNLKGLCPFHNDSKPSFMVSPEKGIAYCFACNTGGDIFKFVQLMEKVEFPEALRILAERTNVKLPEFRPEARDARLRIIEINRATATFFADQLQASPEGMKYFTDRGLTEETIRDFQLGYAPDSFTALKEHLIRLNYNEAELLEAGVLNQRSIADKNTYDRFRHRYIFPIFDHQDNVVGFGGRIIGEGEPKYLNSPETPAYNKSLVLYGLNRAKEMIKKEDMTIFVEGYMDLIAAHQAGSLNTVATSGTALTGHQLKLIKRYSPNAAFAFDQDNAGQEATKRAIELAREAELNIKIVTVPHGKDPDECIRENPESWKQAVLTAVPAMDFYFNYALKAFDPDTLDGKKGVCAILLPLIKQLSSEMEQGQYLDRLSVIVKTDVKLLWNDLKKLGQKKTYAGPARAAEDATAKKNYVREEFLLGFVFQYPQFYPLVAENLIDSVPVHHDTEKFYKALKKIYNQRSVVDFDELKVDLEAEEKEKIDIYALLIEENYPDFSEAAAEKEVKQLIQSINQQNLILIQKAYEFKIRAATETGEKTILLNQYNQILKLKTKIN
jgi:DNA primase